jgi:hypothetical protein
MYAPPFTHALDVCIFCVVWPRGTGFREHSVQTQGTLSADSGIIQCTWPRGTDFLRTLPSVVTSTVEHPSGSPSFCVIGNAISVLEKWSACQTRQGYKFGIIEHGLFYRTLRSLCQVLQYTHGRVLEKLHYGEAGGLIIITPCCIIHNNKVASEASHCVRLLVSQPDSDHISTINNDIMYKYKGRPRLE